MKLKEAILIVVSLYTLVPIAWFIETYIWDHWYILGAITIGLYFLHKKVKGGYATEF